MKSRFLPPCFIAIISLSFCSVFATPGWAQDISTGFEDGSLSPFGLESLPGNVSEVVTPTGFSARAGNKVNRIVWYADNYEGARTGRSVEGQSYKLDRITSEGWYGFSFYAPESFPVPDKRMVLAQIIAWDPSLPNTNITITVGVNALGALILEGAYGVGDGAKDVSVYTPIAPVLTKNTWHDVILYCNFSRDNTGILQAWYDGAPESSPTISATGINLGNGAWTDDNTLTTGGYIKWGPYCYDSANYVPGESREIYYDEISYLVGNPEGAFDLVKAEGYGTIPEGSSTPLILALAALLVAVLPRRGK